MTQVGAEETYQQSHKFRSSNAHIPKILRHDENVTDSEKYDITHWELKDVYLQTQSELSMRRFSARCVGDPALVWHDFEIQNLTSGKRKHS